MNPINIKKCGVKNCKDKIHGRVRGSKESYCDKHRFQLERHGKILERTIFTPNKYITHLNYTNIILYNKKCIEIGRTKIDNDDIQKVKEYKWRINNNGYVVSNSKNRTCIFIHRIICNTPDGMFTDHKNNNKLDNRKKNLRIVNKHQNNINRKGLNKDNTSGFRGVYKDRNNRWFARITIYKKVISLGSYKTIKEAIKARQKGEVKYLGEEVKYIKN